jgi:outer membrane protein assembly factor BamB
MSVLAADHWTSFRGPSNQGHAGDATLPLEWGEEKNVAWKVPVDGKAWSSPVVWGNRIWLTNAPPAGSRLSVLCFDKDSGKQLVRAMLRHVPLPQYCHPFNSYASPSPVIEEGKVYVSFGSPFTGCIDSKSGEVIWQRTDFVCNHFRGAGSSPFIYKDLLILHLDGSDKQYVAALNKHTGETVWQTDRSVDFQDLDPATGQPKLEGDLRKAYSTPVITRVDGKDVLVSLGSMALYGYDPETGEELWRVASVGSHSGAVRPVVGHGLVFTSMGSGGELWAVQPDGRGDVTDTKVAWVYKRAVPRRPSPLMKDDLLFMVTDDGIAACIEAKTGTEVWRNRLGNNFSASPILNGDRIYFFDESGKATVISASSKFEVLATNLLESGFMASPAVSGNALYLRTRTHLYRIEER